MFSVVMEGMSVNARKPINLRHEMVANMLHDARVFVGLLLMNELKK